MFSRNRSKESDIKNLEEQLSYTKKRIDKMKCSRRHIVDNYEDDQCLAGSISKEKDELRDIEDELNILKNP